MYIEFEGKKDNGNEEMIQEFYDSFEKLFKDRQSKILIQSDFKKGDRQPYIEDKIKSFTDKEVTCHHGWGRGGDFVFTIELFYFIFKFENKVYVYSIAFQYQQSTAKINCARHPYSVSKKEEIVDIIPIFKKYSKKNPIYKRVNPGKTRAYISISKKDDNLLEYNINDRCVKVYEILEKSKDLINGIRQDVESIGGKFFECRAIK